MAFLLMRSFIRTYHRSRANNGFIVVAVLWILAALATLASVYGIYVANSVMAARVHDDRIQAHVLMSAALDLTAHQLIAVSEEVRPTRGLFNFRLGGARVAAEFRSEAARIDLNTAPKELLAGLFAALGASPANAENYADRIIGWRLPPGEDQEGKEARTYRVAGLAYNPREAPFVHLGELWLVRDIPAPLIERALPYLTVFSGRGDINVLDAPPLAVAALPGMDPERLHAILSQRAVSRQEGRQVMRLLGAAAQSMATTDGSKAFRVRANAVLDNGRRVTAVAVILMMPVAVDEPFRVLSWADSTDGSILDEPPNTVLP